MERQTLAELKADPESSKPWGQFADSVGLYIRTKTKVSLRSSFGCLADVFDHEIEAQQKELIPLLEEVGSNLQKIKPFRYRYNLDDVLDLESNIDELAEEIYRRWIVIRYGPSEA